tara:strand:- start:82 stop:183 length:102 start_codon:yes stop_codon:yes gene_type:complete
MIISLILYFEEIVKMQQWIEDFVEGTGKIILMV